MLYHEIDGFFCPQAYNLFLKYLRHSPKNCGDVIEAYIGCIESADPSVAVSALEKLADCLPLAQGPNSIGKF